MTIHWKALEEQLMLYHGISLPIQPFLGGKKIHFLNLFCILQNQTYTAVISGLRKLSQKPIGVKAGAPFSISPQLILLLAK
jgi:hypothetical protein